jgi:hypothetical protein
LLQQLQPVTGGASSTGGRKQRQQQQQQPQAQLPHHVADLVLLQSCSSQQQLAPVQLQQLQQVVDAALAGTAWSCRHRQLLCVPPVNFNKAGGGEQHRAPAEGVRSGDSSSGTGVNIWAVPPLSCGSSSNSKFLTSIMHGSAEQPHLQLPPLPQQLQQLTSKLLAWPRSSSSSSSGCFSPPLSEREWLKAAERVWEAVQNSRELLQYYQAAAEVRYVGAVGWRQR